MEKLQSFGWYASRVKPYLPKEAFEPVPSRLLGGLAFFIISIAGIVAIAVLELNVLLNAVIAIILGLCFGSLGFIGHEILHGTVVKTSWLRNLLGAIAFWPLSTGPRLWRLWHNVHHHVHTQDEEKDPDAWPSFEKFIKRPIARIIYKLPFPVRAFVSFVSLTFTFSIHSINMFKECIKQFKPSHQPFVWVQFLLPWATWIGLMFLIGPYKWIFAYVIPLFIANFIVMAYISTNHRLNPLTPVNDPLANSLTVTVPKWVDMLHFNFSYHTEHHLFPAMSPKYYPLVKEQIKRMWPERYHEMPLGSALKALWKTPRIYYKQTELVDPNQKHLYGSLGHGLNPYNIRYREMVEDVQPKEKGYGEKDNEIG